MGVYYNGKRGNECGRIAGLSGIPHDGERTRTAEDIQGEERVNNDQNMRNNEKVCCRGAENGAQADGGMEMCGRCKNTPRSEAQRRQLQSRINRIIGQLNGIKNMIDDNRYCGDILIQVGAAQSALQSLGYIVFQDHMQTCVAEEVRKGNEDILAEAVELMKKLK